jgi:ABC-2 type transport system ATP-binding protein
VIELHNVRKMFGGRMAVESLTLSVPQGEIFGLLGHNGAGKSTAIGMMLGQVWPTAGQIRICGYDVTTDRARALRRVGAIFESPSFYDYLSGLRNLEILSSYTELTPRRRILEVIDWVGLSGREGSAVRTYSHGMRARLALAQAMLPGPNLLILDEPSDGLDPEGIHEMRQMIQKMHKELGVTILLSSHFLSEVQQLCTRIAVLKQGRKVFEGSLENTLRSSHLVKLKTDNFGAALDLLIRTGIAHAGQDHGLLALTDSTGTEAAVRTLVQHGFPVYEIGPVEQTLETFYLSLMRQTPGKEQTPD